MENTQNQDLYDLSDEQLMGQDLSQFEEPNPEEEKQDEVPGGEGNDELANQQPEANTEEQPAPAETRQPEEDGDTPPEDQPGDQTPDPEPEPAAENTPSTDAEQPEAATEPTAEDLIRGLGEQQEVDYKAFWETLTTPFKANGKQIQVTDPNDIIALMQQGANYSKKMAELKPHLGTLRFLQEKGLTDPEKLAFLVDLNDKKPEAIAKLLKDSNVDLYEFDTAQGDNYRPQVEIPEDTSELDDVIKDLEGSPTFERTITLVGKEWDAESRNTVAKNPQILRILDSQMASGLYDQIQQVVDYERTMGRLNNVSDLEAYTRVEVMLRQRWEAQQRQQAVQQPQPAPQPKQVIAPRPTKTTSTENVQQKLRASVPQGTTAQPKAVNDFDPLKVSDAEIDKYMAQFQYH